MFCNYKYSYYIKHESLWNIKIFLFKSLVKYLIMVGLDTFMLYYELNKLEIPCFANTSAYNKLIIYFSLDVSSMAFSMNRLKSNGMAFINTHCTSTKELQPQPKAWQASPWFKNSPTCSCTWAPLQVLGSKHLCAKCCEVALHHIAKFDADHSRVMKPKVRTSK